MLGKGGKSGKIVTMSSLSNMTHNPYQAKTAEVIELEHSPRMA